METTESKRILIVKNAHFSNTKLRKYAKVFTKKKYVLSFIGWKRKEDEKKDSEYYESVRFLHSGGGYGKNKINLALNYIVWMHKLFFFAVQRKNTLKYQHLFLTDFDVALPFYFASKFNKDLKYFYEIRDDFALRYNFPIFIKKIVSKVDSKLKSSARFVIHVDESRIREGDENFVVIKNTPFDFYKSFEAPEYKIKVAVIGHLSKIRGLDQILKFAKDYRNIEFIFAGVEVFDDDIGDLIKSLPNIKVYKRMQQDKLFEIIYDCSGIFSIYDPSLEINLKAASNKLYDAMMLGIPVIVNKEILASDFVSKNKLGFIIDYKYNSSWNDLAEKVSNKKLVEERGGNGRRIFEKDLDFLSICESKLLPQLECFEYKV